MKNKGITLVALVITIIILLILAGITILQLTGNGLFERTEQSKEKYKMAEAKEELNLLITNLKLETYSKNKRNSNLSDFKNLINDKDNLILQEENYDSNNELTGVKVSYKDYIFLIDNNLNIVDNYDNGEEQDKDVVLEYSAKKANVQETVQALKLIDKTENEHNAELNNVYYNDNQKGIVFDGSSSYGTLDSSKLNISFPATVTMSVKCGKGENNILYIDKKSGIGIGFWQSKYIILENDISNGTAKYYDISQYNLADNITYITVVYGNNKSDNKLYINGVEVKTTTQGNGWGTSTNDTTYLGRRYSGSYFNGILYDFKIYNKLFSEQEVMERYQKEKQNFENNTNNVNEQAEYLVLDYVCNSQENENYSKPNIIKNKLNSDYDIKLSNVEYNADKNGLVFNGTSSYGIIEDSAFEVTFPNTITIVVKSNNNSNNLLFTNKLSKIGIGYWKNDYIILENDISDGTVKYYDISKCNLLNEISYFTVVYGKDSRENQLYINGVRAETNTKGNGWGMSETGTYLGRRNSGSYFNGILYKFKIYSRNLSEEEIMKEYQQDKQYYK